MVWLWQRCWFVLCLAAGVNAMKPYETHKFQRVQRVEQNRIDYQLQANIATSLRKLHFKTSLRDVTSPWKSNIAKEDPMVSSRSCWLVGAHALFCQISLFSSQVPDVWGAGGPSTLLGVSRGNPPEGSCSRCALSSRLVRSSGPPHVLPLGFGQPLETMGREPMVTSHGYHGWDLGFHTAQRTIWAKHGSACTKMVWRWLITGDDTWWVTGWLLEP